MGVYVDARLTNYKVATGRRCVSSSWRETTYLHGCKQGEDLNPRLRGGLPTSTVTNTEEVRILFPQVDHHPHGYM